MIAPADIQTSVKTIAEADVDFARLLDRVARGEEVVITRNGKQVARMLPVDPRRSPEAIAALMRQIEATREHLRAAGVRITTEEIIAAKNEGRR